MRVDRAAVMAGLVALASCSARVDARIEFDEGARSPRPSLTIAGAEPPSLVVFARRADVRGRADPTPIWTLVRDPASAVETPLRIEYSVVPTGYQSTEPASMLFPGEFVVTASVSSGRAVRHFVVTRDGRVR